jgi:hypothetical protein
MEPAGRSKEQRGYGSAGRVELARRIEIRKHTTSGSRTTWARAGMRIGRPPSTTTSTLSRLCEGNLGGRQGLPAHGARLVQLRVRTRPIISQVAYGRVQLRLEQILGARLVGLVQSCKR